MLLDLNAIFDADRVEAAVGRSTLLPPVDSLSRGGPESGDEPHRVVPPASNLARGGPTAKSSGVPPTMPPEDDLAELVRWFQKNVDRLPRSRFEMFPWVNVSDPPRFYASLRTDIKAGPAGARARNGALAVDLARLKELFDTTKADS